MNYYVYLLTDPRNNDEVFYCGKGKGDRWKSHLGHWSGNGKNNPTENKIRKIQANGLQPGVIFLHKDINDEELAYSLESAYIKENFGKLTNTKIEAKPPSAKGRVPWNKGLTYKNPKTTLTQTGKKRGSYSEDHRKAISESLKGEKHPMYGKPAHNQTKIKEVNTGQIFKSQTEAARVLKIKQGDISNILNGRQKSTKGYAFEYVSQMVC
jgi:hypothetical protein